MSVTEDLAEQAHELAAKFTERRTFEEARAALNEAGMLRARQRLADALAAIETAQQAVRETADVAKRLNGAVDVFANEVEWELDARFVTEGAKTYLLMANDERKAMTADERAKWKASEARKHESVRNARRLASEADMENAAAKDALALAEKAFSAARHDLDAAIATVQILAASLKKEAN